MDYYLNDENTPNERTDLYRKWRMIKCYFGTLEFQARSLGLKIICNLLLK